MLEGIEKMAYDCHMLYGSKKIKTLTPTQLQQMISTKYFKPSLKTCKGIIKVINEKNWTELRGNVRVYY